MVAAALGMAALPLLWPRVAPLEDLPGHIARWHVAMEIGRSPELAGYYGYAWHLIGNLGMDIAVPPLARLVGLLAAAKLAVIAVPVLTAAGLLWLAREAHGRLPPTALAALPFAYAWPFQFGFINFVLAQALAFVAGALWIRLGRQHRLGFRAIVFAPIGGAIWVAHSAGWGLLGLIAFGADAARQRDEGRSWLGAGMWAAIQCLPMALPLLLVILTRDTSPRSASGDWFDIGTKTIWLISVLRDCWQWLDLAALAAVVLFLYTGWRDRRLGFGATLGLPALLCAAAFVLLPRLMLGGAYVDMRMLPAAFALALLAIRPPADARLGATLALLAAAFLAVRTVATTASFVLRAAEQQHLTAVVDRIPHGAAVLALVYKPCRTPWSDQRTDHLPAYAIIAKDAFVNEQWDLAGQQLISVRHGAAAPFTDDPTQLVYPDECSELGYTYTAAAARFPRRGFSHVWTINAPPLPAAVRDLRPIAASGGSVLYEIVRRP